MAPTAESRVAVIGAGAMGRGIAAVAAAAGHEVYLYDQDAGAAAAAADAIAADWASLVQRGKWSQSQLDAARGRLRPVASLEELADTSLAIEAIVERLDAKKALLRQLDALLPAAAILASNTSSLSITELAAGLRHPERLIGLHFFNPATRMKLVEVVSGLSTAPALAEGMCTLMRAWSKTPVPAASTPGFIVNRVARPFYAEALRLLQEGACAPATLDALLREAGGFAMGPLELMDLIGHDVNFAVTQSVFQAMQQDPRFRPSPLQQELVAAGRLGRKSGRGFYDYGQALPAPDTAASQPKPAALRVHGGLGAAETLLPRLRAGGVRLEREPGPERGWLSWDGLRLALSDGRSATRRAAESGHAGWAVFDLALDYASVPRLALAVADQAAPELAERAAGVLQAAGLLVSRMDDSAGMAVLRTVAMLANEAADAVGQGVAAAGSVDQAMCLGAAYPRGPLAWADRLGNEYVAQVLDALHAQYGDERYRVSPLLRRLALSGGRFHD